VGNRNKVGRNRRFDLDHPAYRIPPPDASDLAVSCIIFTYFMHTLT
jgi:hypothetical protein